MPASDVMYERSEQEAAHAQRIHVLNEGITEFGIQAENVFKEAAEALFGQEPEITASVRAARVMAGTQYADLHDQALALQYAQAGRPSREQRRIVELVVTANAFLRVAEHAGNIAELAQALSGSGELHLQRANCPDPLVLRRIVRQTYLLVRGAVIVCATRDTARARLLARDQETLRSLVVSLKAMVADIIRADPLHAFPFQQLVRVGAEMEYIGTRVVVICDAILER
jgi:phosphate uptake regulator